MRFKPSAGRAEFIDPIFGIALRGLRPAEVDLFFSLSGEIESTVPLFEKNLEWSSFDEVLQCTIRFYLLGTAQNSTMLDFVCRFVSCLYVTPSSSDLTQYDRNATMHPKSLRQLPAGWKR